MLAMLLCAAVAPPVGADELIHQTRTDFAPGSFFQTVMEGLETSPEIRLGAYYIPTTIFYDDTIGGWNYDTSDPGNIAEENPEGQIHLYTEYTGHPNGSWAYASHTAAPIPDLVSVEFRIYLDSIDSSGTDDPFVTQPTGASCRIDMLLTDLGFRMDIFKDRMVSFYRIGDSGIDYPVIAYFDIATATGQWYTIRFDCDFTDHDLPVQIYRDDLWIGELKADTRNSTASSRIRPLAFSRSALSGPAEFHVDHLKVDALIPETYTTGTYTSDALDLQASSLDTFAWDEVSASPLPWHDWVKYEGNPITGPSSLPENMLADLGDPLQQPIEYDGRYWLCYSSGGPGQSIHLAYSTDPELLVWTDYESNPVLSPITGEDYLFSPHLFREGGTYYLFYDVALSIDSRQRLAYATATAPIGPWTRGQIILERGDPGEWDDYRVAECFIVKEDDTYYLFYMGNYDSVGNVERIGVATTTTGLFPLGPETGGHWTKQGAVFSPDTEPGQWDSGLVSNPSIVKLENKFFMRYSGSTNNVDWRVGTAWATDLLGPWHRTSGYEIGPGPSGSWDDDRILRGAIQYHNGKWYSPYSGNDGSGGWEAYRGGMATADPRAQADSLLFETRSSSDGSTWDEWLPVTNGGLIQSRALRYFQYRANFNLSADELSPTLTEVSLTYVRDTTPVEETPLAVKLHYPFPNPFNPRTVIGFTIGARQAVRLAVYDIRGARVALLADRVFNAGHHEIGWDGRNAEGRAVSSGVYFIRMETKNYRSVERAVMIR
jgi:hypothetical protein